MWAKPGVLRSSVPSGLCQFADHTACHSVKMSQHHDNHYIELFPPIQKSKHQPWRAILCLSIEY